MRLEPEMWEALREICLREGLELRELILLIEKDAPASCRTSAVRVHALQYFRTAASEEGHRAAGHGTLADGRPWAAATNNVERARG